MFAQKVLPGLVKHAEDKSAKYPPTLNFHWSYGVYQGQCSNECLCERQVRNASSVHVDCEGVWAERSAYCACDCG